MNKYLVLEWFCRIFSGVIFIVASLHKIFDPCVFAEVIYQYHLVPGEIINLAAILLPYVELIFGFCLIFGIAPRGAALGISIILIVFIILLTINLVRGIDFECGCFSDTTDFCTMLTNWYKIGHPDINTHILLKMRVSCDIFRDILLLIPALGAYLLMNKRLC